MNKKSTLFRQALKRLGLILFPVILFIIAISLSFIRPPRQDLSALKTISENCPFYFGVSFFSQKADFQKNKMTSYILSKSDFIKKIQDLNLYFRKENISLKRIFFALPLTLTKEEEWIVSQKSLFILSNGERKQISHFTFSEINQLHKELNLNYKALKLDFILSFLPKQSNFLFYLVGSDRKKMIKNLEKMQNKINGDLYLSSSNEKLLKNLLFLQTSLGSPLNKKVKILHSFKALVRLEILSVFPQDFKRVLGHGFVIPSDFYPSYETLHLLNQKNELLFFEKEPPYSSQDKRLISYSKALISSQVKLAISSIKDKKTCLIKN